MSQSYRYGKIAPKKFCSPKKVIFTSYRKKFTISALANATKLIARKYVTFCQALFIFMTSVVAAK